MTADSSSLQDVLLYMSLIKLIYSKTVAWEKLNVCLSSLKSTTNPQTKTVTYISTPTTTTSS